MQLSPLHRRLGAPVLLPLYHTVSDTPLPHIDPIYPVRTVRQFTQDLETLLKHYQPIELQQLRLHVSGERPLPHPAFHLTFDDGLRACAEVIAPILTRYGVPATFFLNPPMVDNKALMYRYQAALLCRPSSRSKRPTQDDTTASRSKRPTQDDILSPFAPFENFRGRREQTNPLQVPYHQAYLLDELAAAAGLDWAGFLQTERPYMTLPQVEGLVKAGFSLGAHSNTHPMMPHLPLADALSEALHSWQWIAERFPDQQPAFAFPFSATGMALSFWQMLEKQSDAKWLTFGTAGLKHHPVPWHLERFPVEKSRRGLHAQLLQAYANYGVKAVLGRNGAV